MKQKHAEYDKVKRLVQKNLNPLLEGPAGSGKTTIAEMIAKDLKMNFEVLSMTKQTSVGHIIGFRSVSGTYIPTTFREVYENGGIFLLDEIDAADPNSLLCLNTMDNGFVSFPDKKVYAHKDFRLMATANPESESSLYTGRSKLDFSSKNRYYKVSIPRDPELEKRLTDEMTVSILDKVREIHVNNGSSVQLTMRDAIRYHAVKDDGDIIGDPVVPLLGGNDGIYEEVKKATQLILANSRSLSEAENINELYEMIEKRRQ